MLSRIHKLIAIVFVGPIGVAAISGCGRPEATKPPEKTIQEKLESNDSKERESGADAAIKKYDKGAAHDTK